ncbi:MAG: DUF1207 domain-containing protein [Planctomycetia bacterium]|nr:DUF1207 domain-containing protein [Planctomycetia bacterium]
MTGQYETAETCRAEEIPFPFCNPIICTDPCMDSDSFCPDSTYNIPQDHSGRQTRISGQNTDITPQEAEFISWDPSFRACIPGLGRALPRSDAAWRWQIFPTGILFRSYFASITESRMGVQFIHESRQNINYWDPTLGGRFGMVRYGNFEKLYPEGFQLDVECAALARLTLDGDREVWGTDYRFGCPLTFRYHHWEFKFGYYHISSHRGDELMVRQENPRERRNYVRDTLMLAAAYRPDANWRFYFEMNYAVWTDEGAKPWQFELGCEYSPMMLPSVKGSPFFALHCRFSEDNDFGSTLTFQLGWQWKTLYQHTFRTGLYFLDGYPNQYQFYDRKERQIGWGFWYDF